ncbi:hypothetical protein HCG45_10935 [Pseudomonas fulva]|uniref:hypothetical protein n=1 Tax=Pseudomonas fulva TaxID=47880 RepID=UPI001428C92C|nr:hypothetical protein [Pseudomonas fulva]
MQNNLSQEVNCRTYHYCQGRIANELGGKSSQVVVQYETQLLALQFREKGMYKCSLLRVDQQRTVLHRTDHYQSQQQLVYTPYGHPSQHPGWLGFNGERPDSMTCHYLLGNGRRGFNPVLMRFNALTARARLGLVV